MEIRILEILNEIKSLIQGRGANQWLNIGEVSSRTSCSKSTLRRAVQSGALRCSKKTGKLLFKASDIERWLNG